MSFEADAEYQLKVQQSEENRARDLMESLDYVITSPLGRAFVYNHLALCNVMGSSFAGEETHKSAFNEGLRNAGLRLLNAVMSAHPRAFMMMQAEHLAREERYHVIPPEFDEGTDE